MRQVKLKDLQLKLKQPFRQDIAAKQRLEIASVNAEVACSVIDHMFRYIDLCLREDKSKVKLSLFAKSFVRGLLNDNVKAGISDFVRNMNNKEIELLLDDIELEISKRRKYK